VLGVQGSLRRAKLRPPLSPARPSGEIVVATGLRREHSTARDKEKGQNPSAPTEVDKVDPYQNEKRRANWSWREKFAWLVIFPKVLLPKATLGP
jgi:hypothetical protein